MSHNEHTPEHHEHVDQWHMHTSTEGLPQEEHGARANPWVLLAVFVFSIIFLVVFIGATIVYAKGYVSGVRARKAEITVWANDARANKAVAEQQLSSYGWVEPGQGRVRIPIESVMQEMSGHGLGIPAPSGR